jgi:hypothetical protein
LEEERKQSASEKASLAARAGSVATGVPAIEFDNSRLLSTTVFMNDSKELEELKLTRTRIEGFLRRKVTNVRNLLYIVST